MYRTTRAAALNWYLARRNDEGLAAASTELGAWPTAHRCFTPTSRGVPCRHEAVLRVHFRDVVIGTFRADIVVHDRVLVELKAGTRLVAAHEAQLINCLRGSGLAVGLLFDFGASPEMRRLMWTRDGQRLQHE